MDHFSQWPIQRWRGQLANDFTAAVSDLHDFFDKRLCILFTKAGQLDRVVDQTGERLDNVIVKNPGKSPSLLFSRIDRSTAKSPEFGHDIFAPRDLTADLIPPQGLDRFIADHNLKPLQPTFVQRVDHFARQH
jgi:hypothetical protein